VSRGRTGLWLILGDLSLGSTAGSCACVLGQLCFVPTAFRAQSLHKPGICAVISDGYLWSLRDTEVAATLMPALLFKAPCPLAEMTSERSKGLIQFSCFTFLLFGSQA
jgi:hypothetical protein